MTPEQIVARIAAEQRGRPAGPKPAAVAEGTAERDRLREVIEALRAAEALDSGRNPDVLIGEFLVPGTRVPISLIAGLQTLTRTEAAVLRFLGWGRANGDIAMLLGMTDATVRSHLNNTVNKLDVDGVRALNSLAGLLFHPID